jgi:dipeptidyl aminopeptidase/acylaminoacyl peptidase
MNLFDKVLIGCRSTSLATCVFFASFPTCAVAAPESSIDEVFDSLDTVHDFREVSISPDGQRVAWVEQFREPGGAASSRSAIYVSTLTAAGIRPQRITALVGDGACEEHDVTWSPDGRNLAFLSDAYTPKQLQLFVALVAGGPARKLTTLQGFLTVPRFSPDGRTIALLFTEKAPRVIGPLLPVAPSTGVIGSEVYEQRLTTVDIDSGRVRQLSPSDMYVYEYDWSPDSKRFAAVAAHGESDANWYIAQLYVLDIASGGRRSIYKPPLQIGAPRWSPDGKSVAFIGGIMSDEGRTGGDIFLVPSNGGEARNLTPGMKATANWLCWKSDGQKLFFYEDLPGATGVASLDFPAGHITALWRGQETLADVPGIGTRNIAFSLSADGTASALVREFYSMPPEVWAGPVGSWRQLTHLNSGVRPILGKVESIEWPNEGLQIQGWLAFPRNYDPGRRYPMIVQVHGGPSSVSRVHWFFDLTVLAHEGYFVFLPNPRGSFGRGEDFTRGNVKDFGYGDFRDILSGVDYVVKKYPVDDNRIGISGWSYGGYLTMWAVTQTRRFRAAVAGAGIANWQSYYGQNDIDQWLLPFFGASVYDDPAIYARSSPITFIKNARTPTLVLVGERDGECPIPQSFEFWHALKTFGIDTQLVIYPDEGHRMSKPQNQRDVIERTLYWFNRYLKDQ